MKAKDLERFQNILNKERARVSREVHSLEATNSSRENKDSSGYGIHMAEMGNEEEEFEKNLMFLSNEGNILDLIDKALRKIGEGTYGICEDCGVTIPKARLIAKPFAKYCIKCRMSNEQNGNNRKW